jgi:uroporphyrinogen decarboxylase
VIKGKAAMTNGERIEALLRREKPDRVPIYPWALGFATVYTQHSIADWYNKPDVSLAAQRKTYQDFDWVSMPHLGIAVFGGWEFGGEIKWPTEKYSQAPTISRYAVETPEDAMNLKMPDVRNSGIVPMQMEFCKLALQERPDNEPFKVVFFNGDTFLTASNICGIEKLSKWMLKKPEAAHRLMRLATDYLIGRAQYFKDTFGTEWVLPFTGEPTSANQVISPKQFEEFALPYLKETHERVLAMGFKTYFTHICGEQNLNLPYWAQIPMGDPGLVSFGHEVDLETAVRYFPNDVIIGNLEPAIIQEGSPEQVYEATRKVVEKGKNLPTGFIFAPGCELPPMASLDNIKAMNKAVDNFGWY